MGRRDILLWSVAGLVGLALAANLLRRERVAPPKSFTPVAARQQDFQALVDKVNTEFQESWRRQNLETAPRADDLTIARRLSLGLTGSIPSLEEIRRLEKVPEADRLDWWISHLLEDRRYSDYLAERLTRAWVGTDEGPFLIYRRRRFRAWISDRLHSQDLSYDGMVRKLLTGQGLWTDEPAVNFITATATPDGDNQPDPVKLANRTSRAFLGMRIDCLQCHDDRLDKVTLGTPDAPRGGLQQDFHQLAAFFADVGNTGAGIRDNRERPYQVKFLGEEKEHPVEAATPYASELRPQEDRLRVQLANWVTSRENKQFGRAAVNRIWALLCGRPLVQPVDEVPFFGPFPPGLETLADDFQAHNCDLRRLIRAIAATDAFQRASRADFEITPQHESTWAVFPLTRLRPEQVAGSVFQASSLSAIDADSHVLQRLTQFGQTNEFVKRYGDMGEDEFVDRGGTIPQRLLLMNGDMVSERTKENFVLNASTRLAVLAASNEEAVEAAYLAILSRRPTPAELQFFACELPSQRGTERNGAMEDLCWILINSSEFSWNH